MFHIWTTRIIGPAEEYRENGGTSLRGGFEVLRLSEGKLRCMEVAPIAPISRYSPLRPTIETIEDRALPSDI